MNEKFEKYIEGLSPEMQEKARACNTKEELNAFIAENDLELPEDALELVSGGCGTSTPKPCSHVSETTVESFSKKDLLGSIVNYYKKSCNNCGAISYYRWNDRARYPTEISEGEYNAQKAQS